MSSQPMSDPYASIARPVDPYAAIARSVSRPAGLPAGVDLPQPESHPAVTMNAPKTMQETFDANTQTNPNDSLLQTGLKSATSAVGTPLIHPLKTVAGLGHMIAHPIDEAHEEVNNIYQDKAAGGLPYAATKVVGQLLGGALLGEAGGAIAEPALRAAGDVGSAIRTAAIGNPDVPLLRGLGIGARSKQGLGTIETAGEGIPESQTKQVLSEAQGARPYGKGAKNQADLQDKLVSAREEINAPLNKAFDVIGNRVVNGPDGPTTLNALESERSQLSAQLRGIQNRDPLAVQTAMQKGLGEADLKARYNAVVNAMTPELDSTGIDSRAIRQQDAQVASTYARIAGRSTLPEEPRPYGFARAGNLLKFGNGSGIDLLAPMKEAGGIGRDIAAGRYWSERPTDVNIREGFRLAGPKPDFGMPQPPNLSASRPLGLPSPAIQLSGSPEVGGTPEGFRPPPFYHDTDAMRTGRLLEAPPIELGGRVEGTPPPPFRYDTTPMRKGMLLPEPGKELPISSYSDIFPNQRPGSRLMPKTIEGKK